MAYGDRMGKVWHTVVETDHFILRAKGRLTDVEKSEFIAHLAGNPGMGPRMEGTGGVRKARWAVGGQGKSGGVRVVYFHHNDQVPIFLIEIFAKKERANVTNAEKNLLRAMARELVKAVCRKEATMRKAKLKRPESGILTGMRQALAYAQGDTEGGVEHHFPKAVDVRAVRLRQRMSQGQFARVYGFSIDSLQNWEQGRRVPDGPARALLAVIDFDASTVIRALKHAAKQL